MKIERAGFILDSDMVHDNVQIIDNATGSTFFYLIELDDLF